jgi:hypothetical protein
MAIGKETSNPLFSMIHLSQVLTHLDVMRIVCNLYVLMYNWSCAAKNGDFQFLVIIEILILLILCCWCSFSILLIGDLSRNLELNGVKFKIRGGL